MTRSTLMRVMVLGVVATVAVTSALAFKDDVKLDDRNYTQGDSSPGGIKGKLDGPSGMDLRGVYALPPSEPRFVYKAKLSTDKKSFSFSGLPAGTYDLMVIFENAMFEGIQLIDRRIKDTLTREDQIKIDQTLTKSEKFWKYKTIHRLEGTTGRGNRSKAIVTMHQPGKTDGQKDLSTARFAYKVYFFKQVGPGWQAEKNRNVLSIDAKHAHCRPRVEFSEDLQKIRVSDYVKDVGTLVLH